ncbi:MULTISPECIES: tyrosine-type recombinase/integrase [Bacillaceae]|uniref:tyrosine-type recombinase/integrase n=1 Tax=Bacillaceae TaxID=186817 RepID=UPI000AD2E7E4|nr:MULTISPECIES: site-specific integrase [Bacillaceae]
MEVKNNTKEIKEKGLPLFGYDPSNPKKDFHCGNSMFSDMEWDFNGYVDKKHLSGARLKIKFYAFEHKPEMLEVVKWFMHHEMTTGDILTAKRSMDGIVKYIKFINEYVPEVESFAEISKELLIAYFDHLLIAKSETTGNPLSPVTIKKAALAIKEVLIKGSVKGWDVPDDVGYVQRLYDDKIINNKALKTDSKKQMKKLAAKVSDEDLIDKIVKTAMKDLEQNRNILVASATVITLQLGLRISEIITIETGCLKPIGGETMIDCGTEKLHSERIEVLKPANELVIEVISKLEEYSRPLRKESGLPYLFLNRKRNEKGYPVALVNHPNWNKNYLRPWLREHQFYDSNGNLIDFTSHTLRHAFATYALKGGASIEVISEIMNHKTIRGTQHYTHPIQEEVKRRFNEVLNEGAILSGKKALQIKDKLKEHNPFKGKTTDQVDKLRRAMKIQVLSHGLCLHHPMRNEPCAGDGVCLGCRNFLTTPEFLDVHKGRLERVRNELSKVPSEGPYENKLRRMESYLVDIIKDLEKQLNYSGEKDNTEYKNPAMLGG